MFRDGDDKVAASIVTRSSTSTTNAEFHTVPVINRPWGNVWCLLDIVHIDPSTVTYAHTRASTVSHGQGSESEDHLTRTVLYIRRTGSSSKQSHAMVGHVITLRRDCLVHRVALGKA